MCKGKIKDILRTRWPDATFLAEGGNSYVYSAHDGDGKPIAVKVYKLLKDHQRYKRFVQEVSMIKTLRGTAGIVDLIESNENPPKRPVECDNIETLDHIAYFTMPLFKGNLTSLIPSLPADDGSIAVDIVLQCARIIQRLHKQYKAHRDFKPENILHNNDGFFVVSDYGLSVDLSDIPEERLTGSGEQIGSLTYRAPELLRGRLDADDHRPVDVYALGRTLWALLMGKEPHGITDFELSRQKIASYNQRIKRPAQLDRIIEAATYVDPKHRMVIETFIEALEQWRMEFEKGSFEDLSRKLENNPHTLGMDHFFQEHKEKLRKRESILSFVGSEMSSLTQNWANLANKTPSIKGGEPVVEGARYYPDFLPDQLDYESFPNPNGLLFRFNLSLNVAPRLQLAIYIDWEANKYRVIGAYLPLSNAEDAYKDFSTSTKIYDSGTITFDYLDENVPSQMAKHVATAYEQLNKVLLQSLA